MVILDTNILLYAHNKAFPQHEKVKRWLTKALSDGHDAVGIPWQVATAFLRISTSTRVFKQPFTLDFAKGCLDDLFNHPLLGAIGPTDGHWTVYSRLLTELGLTGDIVMDAHIAALAVEHKAAVATTDKDFRRFSDYVRLLDPLTV